MAPSRQSPTPAFQVCTIAARNYLPQVRVLAESYARHHSGQRLTALIIDDEDRQVADEAEGFRCWRLEQVGLDRAEIGRLATYYDVTELATAIKPRFIRALIEESGGPVVYLDPDIKIFDRLDGLAELVASGGVVLTPHSVAPYPRDGRHVNESSILGAGAYNLGFIGVPTARVDFLDWWWARTRREAFVDPPRMQFTDQRWIDLVPGHFDHIILKDVGYNVAYWNLHGRHITWTGSEYQVNDRPLRFFHFSGFDPARGHLLSKHQRDAPRILLSEHPSIARLCREYSQDLERTTAFRAPQHYGWGRIPGGLPIDHRMRRLFREALLTAEAEGTCPPPSPFDTEGPEGFMAWLRAPVDRRHAPWVSRYVYSVYADRPDLVHAFPDLIGADQQGFHDWLRNHGASEIPTSLMPSSAAVVTPPARPASLAGPPPGLNLVAYVDAQSGVGEFGRLVRAAAEAAAIPIRTTVADGDVRGGDGDEPYDVTLLCVNADQTPNVRRRLGPALFRDRWTVGLWSWEVGSFPTWMAKSFDDVDEVWVASEHVAAAFRGVASKPVSVVRPALVAGRAPDTITRGALGLPGGFLFLFMFDFRSVIERKNPEAVIDAFTRAFAPGEGPSLVLKTINGNERIADLERLRARAAGRPDVRIIDRRFTSDERHALLTLSDCYVSLHRAEGLGLTLAEAMSLGKPVIATGYSGNLEFMTCENALLVDYTMSAVPPGCEPYTAGVPWAEPSVTHAARLMRRVYDEPVLRTTIGARAADDIAAGYSASRTGHEIARRLEDIRRQLGRTASRAASATQSGPAGDDSLTQTLRKVVRRLRDIEAGA